MQRTKKIIITVLSFFALGAVTGELEARRGGRGGGARMGGARMGGRRGGGARMGARRGGARIRGRGGRRYGYRGRGWHGGRWRRGRRWGYGPWRYRRPWGPAYWGGWWPGVTVVSSDYYDDYDMNDYRDDMGYNYWDVRNSTNTPIEVRASGGTYYRVMPGGNMQIPRNASFTMKVKASDGQRMKFATHNHYVEIMQGKRGTLRHRTWNG